ncbi:MULTISPECIES: 3-hexulose-6-phosphate synthase [Peribacillus]|uniref:3-hexulose-6-phosphate synthase n=1 Tax=Peribacillus TaxID=2675229 RepID=UPI00191324B1|nr:MULTISPECIES: 3-hexulose-6-phosphate synthase [unclassified Peribacillus]MBK5443470.1 orotidine 5'-phosphate decarboxylase [Peribacillus sp. TH24]MBK5461798.1 orotidine 5'-phosphate decarboxylase [Peribacillus sp. TH27]MBK5484866.1 orotidine 5'-phosphate decarboxylase [Peribacillus sp. TH16]MBK5499950.1 orotidine 5'-phosphate decarboxylase [Peribacillus sp. TH14]WMX54999.1 3-hexulose-6-phosphate synthase [Peribacillus sp. R9-11]
MIIQLALDRMNMKEAIEMARTVESSIDWIEVGTSLIKEFGTTSIKKMKNQFPDKKIVADMKTMDNAAYEMDLCFEEGADVATVMGAAPDVTIQKCLEKAREYKGQIMIDLLNVPDSRFEQLQIYNQAVFCEHVSKDSQEIADHAVAKMRKQAGLIRAVAGGITLATLPEMIRQGPDVIIIGSAITKAKDPAEAARLFKETINMVKGVNEA